MRGIATSIACLAAAFAAPADARTSIDAAGGSGTRELPAVLQCVPYAREVTGIQIYGDAHTWWQQAEGRYARGRKPREGAVMAFRPHANSRLGHVAAVSRVVDTRTVLLRHANWSQPGLIERDVKAVDVSATNDWSEVQVWYAPSGKLGTTHWPLAGFIYGDRTATSRTANSRPAKSSRWADDPIGEIIANAGR